ncbi:MAG TPA: hypothetical protein VNS79_03920 [Sphingobium sp.]|nr:hypothetical protein [Sphingobium sp.]
MALVARIVPAKGGRIIEKRLGKAVAALAVPEGGKVEIVDSETGAPVRAHAADESGQGLLLKFATPDGDVALVLTGAVGGLAAALVSAQAVDAAAAAGDGAQDEAGDAQSAGASAGEAERHEGGQHGGGSPMLLGLLGLGALGGIAAAVSGGGGGDDASPPVDDGGKTPEPTFTVSDDADGAVSFGGSATGPISITLNAGDEAIFSRDGKAAATVVGAISTKVLHVPDGGEVRITINGAATSDTFTLNAPNAAKMVFSGDGGGGLNDTLTLIIESATPGADTRLLTLDTSGLTGVGAIRFVFPDDANDVVKLTAQSNLAGFDSIEVSRGGVDMTAVTVQPGVEFIVNSTLILTLAQFEAMASVISVTGMGHLTINLTAGQIQSHALDAFLSSAADKPMLIGTTVTLHDPDGHVVAIPAGLAAISYPGIPELADRVSELESRIDGLGINDVGDLVSTLTALNGAIAALQSATDASSGALGDRVAALESQLAGITDTVVSYVGAQIAAVQAQIGDLAIDDIAGLAGQLATLTESIAALAELGGEGLSDLQSQIDAINEAIGGLGDHDAPTILEMYLASATGADADGHLNAGDVVTAMVKFSEVVLVSGHPTLALTIGDGEDTHIVQATLVGGAGTDTLTFSYTVNGTDRDATGISIGEDALFLGEDSGITDAAGNALDRHSAAVADNPGFIIDNTPLELTMRAASIFGEGDAPLVVGLMLRELSDQVQSFITLDDLDANGDFVVPDGQYFIRTDDFIDLLFGKATGFDPDWLMAHALGGGETASFNLSNQVVLEYQVPLVVSENALRVALSGEHGPDVLNDSGVATADEFISRYTETLDALNAFTGSVISPEFMARIQGHDPADVMLDITTPLTVAQAAALAAAGFALGSHVDYTIRDYYTSVQAALADPHQAAALQNAGQVIARGDELDNIISMTSFNLSVNLRSELGDGNDIYNAGRGDEIIVGGRGADTINLTYNDNSRDAIVYESIYDGRTASVVALNFSTDADKYREGSKITITVNGHVYSYTTGDNGETPTEALGHLADAVMAKQVDAARVAIGLSYRADGSLDGFVYQDDLVNGAYTVQAGHYFLSATDYLYLLAENDVVMPADVRSTGLRGGETFRLTSEDYLQIDGALTFAGTTTILAYAPAYEAFLEDPCALVPAAERVQDAIRYRDAAQIKVDGDTGRLTLTGGVYTQDTHVGAGAGRGYHHEGAIENPGEGAIASITFAAGEDDYPGATNNGHTTEFDRELRVTISGRTITANIVEGDPVASVEALRAAIEAAMADDAMTAITAAYSTIDLDGQGSEEAVLGGYALTLTINGVAVTLTHEGSTTMGEMMDAIRAVGGVQSVALKDGDLVITGEVRGTEAEKNSVSITGITISDTAHEAVDTAAVGGSLVDLIKAVASDGTTLTFTGFVPDTDDDAPTFTIDNGEIDKPGIQQELTLSFSEVDADYYAGGQLHVTINGVTIDADMVAGSAYGSIAALVTAINAAIAEDSAGALLLESATLEYLPSIVPGPVNVLLVASAESPDALDVTKVMQDYRGEEQTATITLEDALSYSAQAGAHADAADRFANVYFEGGKVHATFVPRISDGDGGLIDGTPVTVSADMVTRMVSTLATDSYSADHYIGDDDSAPFAISITVDGRTYTASNFVTYLAPSLSLVNGEGVDGSDKATFADLADWIASLDGVASAVAGPDGITITYEAGSIGSIDLIGGAEYAHEPGDGVGALQLILNEGSGRVDIANGVTIGDPEGTAQALADAINAATGQVIHYAFDMDGHAALTLDSVLTTDFDHSKIVLDMSVNGVSLPSGDYHGEELPDIHTLGELLAWVNEQYAGEAVWSLNKTGDGLDVRVAKDAIITGGIQIDIGLTDAVLSVDFNLSVIDPATLSFIGHAEADGTSITITAAQVGKDTFAVSDATMDYEGVHQIATADYDADGNYYDGGIISLDIDTTPGEEGGIVHIQANMVAGDREASLKNLVDAINSAAAGPTSDAAARVVLASSENLWDGVTNGGEDFDEGLYVSSWSVTVGMGEDAVTYSGGGDMVDIGDGQFVWDPFGENLSQFTDLGGFLAYISGLPGVGTATLDEDGNIVITTDATGAGAFIDVAYDLAFDVSDEGQGWASDTGSASGVAGSDGALNGIIDHAVLGADGTITIVSADAVEQQFAISEAVLSRETVRQEADAAFGHNTDHYYDGGKIGITVNGVTVETDMVMKAASSTYTGPDGRDAGEGSFIGSADFAFAITIDGTSYTTAEFTHYLTEKDLHLSEDFLSDQGADVATMQDLAEWIETLSGVDSVTFADGGWTIVYDADVQGVVDSFAGWYLVGGSVVGIVEGELTNVHDGDSETTLQNLRDAIWEQVNHAELVIDLSDFGSLDGSSVLGANWVLDFDFAGSDGGSVNAIVAGSTLDDLLSALESQTGVASARLDGTSIVIVSQPGFGPISVSITGVNSGDLGLDAALNGAHEPQAGLYGAFSSVTVGEDGSLHFTAADAVDGYGEIVVTDIHMSVAAREQITTIDFDDVDFATGLVNEDGDRGQVSITVAGQTITADMQGTQSDTIRALAQAIIEARDGSFVEHTAAIVRDDHDDSGALVIQTGDDRAISADDAISMDKVSVTLTIDDVPQTHVFTPALVAEPGGARPSVSDFMNWLEESFDGVTASIADGKIILEGTALTGGEAILTLLDTDLGGTDANMAIGQVDFDGTNIVVHGAHAGPDQLNVSGISYDRVDTTSSEFQQIVVEFNNSKLDNIADGSVVKLTLLGVTTSITVSTNGMPGEHDLDLFGIPTAERSSVILDALIAKLGVDHPGDALGVIERGSRDGDGIFTVGTSGTSVTLLLTADAYGQSVLGPLAEIEAAIYKGATLEFSVTAEQIHAGSVNFTGSAEGTSIADGHDGAGGQAGRNDAILHYQGGEDGSGSYLLTDVTNGGTLALDDGEFADLGLDIRNDMKEGVGPDWIDQGYVNAGDGSDGTDPSFYGDAAGSGEHGVQQTHQNPDGSYTAADGSPAYNEANVSTGSDDHYGGASGYYDADGLHTDHLDGHSTVDGEDYYDVDPGVGSDTAVSGAYHGEATDSDSGEDGFHHDDIQDGFAAFTWDHVFQSTVAQANAGPDVINHFQVDRDVIVLDGALEASTVVGGIDYVHGTTAGAHFDLDTDEFGFVSSGVSGLDVSALSNANAVAERLEELFYLTAHGEDHVENSSIFAINAHDDPTTTAIWAHTQSSNNDHTIDANELTLLAIIHTTGGEFGRTSYDNLLMMHPVDVG